MLNKILKILVAIKFKFINLKTIILNSKKKKNVKNNIKNFFKILQYK